MVAGGGGGGGVGGGRGGGRGGRRRRRGGVLSPRRRCRTQQRVEESTAEASGASGGSAGPASKWPVAEWPLQSTRDEPPLEAREQPKKPPPVHVTITGGTCVARGLRLLTQAECEAMAVGAGHKFIGRAKEPTEFPGCVRWGGGFVEWNQHDDEHMGCTVGGESTGGVPPACLCGGPK
jgi:hypothetical protein